LTNPYNYRAKETKEAKITLTIWKKCKRKPSVRLPSSTSPYRKSSKSRKRDYKNKEITAKKWVPLVNPPTKFREMCPNISQLKTTKNSNIKQVTQLS
jgi:hypothetical protein